MLALLFYTFLLLISVLFYLIILKPLVPLLILKIKYGKKVRLDFFPLMGIINYIKNSEKLYGDCTTILDARDKQNPDIIAIITNTLTSPQIIFCDTKYQKFIFQEHHLFSRLKVFPINSVMDKGLVFTEGEPWKKQRKLLSHAFSYEQLMSRIPTIKKISKESLNEIVSGETIDALEYSTKITGEVVIRTFFGHSFGPSVLNGRNASVEIQSLFGDLTVLYDNLFFTLKFLLVGYKAIYYLQSKQEKEVVRRVDLVREKAKEVIIKRFEQIKEGQVNEEGDFLDVYMKDIKVLTPEFLDEMIHQFITFFFAGTDTTAHLILWMLYNLALYPEIQEEVRDEVKQIYTDKFQDEDIKKLVKVQGLINEVLRMNTFVESFLPRSAKQDVQVLDFYIKKGWYVNAAARFNMMHPKHFNNPEVFSIQRWLNQDDQQLSSDPLKCLPFLAAGRNCIGQHLAQFEAKIVICDILSNYRIVKTVENPKTQLRFMVDFLDNRVLKFVKL